MVSASRLCPWYLTLGMAGNLYSVSDCGGTDKSLVPSARSPQPKREVRMGFEDGGGE